MNHRLRTRIFKILSLLPNRLGYTIYYFIQNSRKKYSIDYKIRSTKIAYNVIVQILKKNSIELKAMQIAEIGSGWVPILPYQLILEGNAKSVETYDINEHYNAKEISQLNKYYSKLFDFEKEGKYNLNKNVTYFPKTDICDGKLTDIDLVVSRFVLEHVEPNIIVKMHDFLFSNLKSGSLILHLISPSDHRAYSDSSLSMHDFLKYSKEEWNRIQTKFDYHNRLRLPQYIALFKDKFEILYFEHDTMKINSESYKKFKELEIHDDFSKFSEQELMAGSINILLKKL